MERLTKIMREALPLLLLFTSLASYGKIVRKVTVTPSTAKIYVDGNYVGDGVAQITMKKSDGFVVVRMEEEDYVPLEVKIFANDSRNAIAYTLRRDAFLDVTVASGTANKYFAVQVSKDLYSVDENGHKNTEMAWKMIHQVLLNYFDEIQTTDFASGFVQTPWKYQLFPEVERVVRTRVSVKESNIGGDLTFQIKISSEAAPIQGRHREESYREINRVVKEFEPIVSEFQTRLGKQ
ncbi:MAG: hypothetical protein LUC33_00040 [Prevotellaceae bacterium]|nr:hypothetical protein [Prevotellaceae bacterium]